MTGKGSVSCSNSDRADMHICYWPIAETRPVVGREAVFKGLATVANACMLACAFSDWPANRHVNTAFSIHQRDIIEVSTATAPDHAVCFVSQQLSIYLLPLISC